MADNEIDINLELAVPQSFRVVACKILEGLSERTHATVEVASTEDIEFDDVLADDATVMVSGMDDRRWSLKLGRAAYIGDHDGSFRYQLELYDPAWLLGFTKNTRKFRNLSAQEIISTILGEFNIEHQWQITRETPKRKYCVQYRESNLDFIQRLLEYEGIYYRFDETGVMILGDSSPSAPRIERSEPFELLENAGGLQQGEVGIHVLRRNTTLKSGRVTLGDYSWKTPKLMLREAATGDRDGDLELYGYPAGFRKPDQGSLLAKLRLEAERVSARVIEGNSNIAQFQPGVGFTFGSITAGDLFAGEYLLVHVEHQFRVAEMNSLMMADDKEVLQYENSFWGIPLKVPFRPPVKTPRPTVAGTHTAMVRGPSGSEIHTDQHGRFRAQLHWDREGVSTDDDSRWMRKLQEVSTSMNLNRVGWEVFITHIDGDPDRPIGLGRAINGVATPTYGLPANKNMMSIKTPSSPASGGFNEIKMDDSAGSQHISMQAEKDLDALVKNDKSETIGCNETHTVGVDLARQITKNQSFTVGNDSHATYGRHYELQVQGSREKVVGADETIKVGGDRTVRCNDTETVGLVRLTIAGSFTMPDIKAMAKSAAMQFARGISPGATSLYDKGKGLYDKGKALSEDGALEDAATDYLKGVGKKAGEKAFDAAKDAAQKDYKENKDIGSALGSGLSAGGESLQGSWNDLKNDWSYESLQNKYQEQLSGLQGDFNKLAPTQETFSSSLQSSASTLTGGLSDSLTKGDYMLALNQAINMFCSGGITRSADGDILKVVGGAWITAAVGNISWKIGYGYAETVGGVKLTFSLDSMNQSVGKCLIVTVGGSIIRNSVGKMTISSKKSAINVGGAALFSSDIKLELRAPKITLEAGTSFVIQGGGAQIVMSPGDVSILGDLNLEASGKVATCAGLVDITE